MHTADAPIAESGGAVLADDGRARPVAQGQFRLFWHPGERMEPVRIDKPLVDGETLPTAGTPICNGSRRSMAATTHAVDSSHAPMLSHPDLVIDVIRAASIAVQGVSTAA
jgi:hypothetical protein